jgi:hypothetical protein
VRRSQLGFGLASVLPFEKQAPFPRNRLLKKGLWDCKVTPAYCSCQEINTIGCIFNNDGLDAGVEFGFSTRGIHAAFPKADGGPVRRRFSGFMKGYEGILR